MHSILSKKICLSAVIGAFFAGLFFVFPLLSVPSARAQQVIDIAFPVDGPVTFNDTFGEPRSGGRVHEGTDLIGEKMTPLLAANDGYISKLVIPEASWGYAIYIKGDDGYTYAYLHVNNDTPGTDDGNGGLQHAYAPGISNGARVTRGQLIGWMGDSGNAENVTSHLHFEIRMSDGTAIDSYASVLAAQGETVSVEYVPEDVRARTPTINADKYLLSETEDALCLSSSLITSPESKAVYYCGADGKRYVFPNDRIYFSWYDDFSEVIEVPAETLAQIRLGGNVTYRPGITMVKITTDPKVYAIDRGGVLRWVTSEEKAEELYGAYWNKEVQDIADVFLIDYIVGEWIE